MKESYHHGDLRAALLEAGLDHLNRHDAETLSLRALARSVGVSATAVYRHFPDKTALVAALAREGLARLADAQKKAAAECRPSESAFAATGRAYVRFALENPALFRLTFASAPVESADEPTEAARMLRENAARRLPDGASAGHVEAEALRAWALVHGIAMLMLDGQIAADPDLVEALIPA
ncbi:TetR/AcrR family transcriptional regulator [Pararhizobium mangrovi]|uniref:TetR/AcrR family transcriptional regulator n=1 Tax=Pararhizobium mangrovi TaxID=2590452 RepID=A0A506TY73_9HYPH|nr:TetR/AcrR family transcriptional regulator [Pararhizobium mangrovi]TPW26450.1 TetR/AcrR family transcriptional regulator [Pararhizobium mangrovi]